MGMFDTIKDELYCPFCGHKHGPGRFQTKDFNNMLEQLSLKDFPTEREIRIYSSCSKCEEWIELIIDRQQHTPRGKTL